VGKTRLTGCDIACIPPPTVLIIMAVGGDVVNANRWDPNVSEPDGECQPRRCRHARVLMRKEEEFGEEEQEGAGSRRIETGGIDWVLGWE